MSVEQLWQHAISPDVCPILDGSCSLQLSTQVLIIQACDSLSILTMFVQISLGTDWFFLFQEAMAGHFAFIGLEHSVSSMP